MSGVCEVYGVYVWYVRVMCVVCVVWGWYVRSVCGVCVMCSVCTYVWCQGMRAAPRSQARWLHHVCPWNLCEMDEIATTPFSTQAPDQFLRSSWGGTQ